jgi:hypothetical protein
MNKPYYRAGQLCDPHDPPRVGMVRLLHKARFVDDAWVCRNIVTGLLGVRTEAQLDQVIKIDVLQVTSIAAAR